MSCSYSASTVKYNCVNCAWSLQAKKGSFMPKLSNPKSSFSINSLLKDDLHKRTQAPIGNRRHKQTQEVDAKFRSRWLCLTAGVCKNIVPNIMLLSTSKPLRSKRIKIHYTIGCCLRIGAAGWKKLVPSLLRPFVHMYSGT